MRRGSAPRFAALGGHTTEHAYLRAIKFVLVLDSALLVFCFVASLLLPRPRPAYAPDAAPADAQAVTEAP